MARLRRGQQKKVRCATKFGWLGPSDPMDAIAIEAFRRSKSEEHVCGSLEWKRLPLQSFDGSARRPVRMIREQSVDEADFVNQKETEDHTD